VIGSVQDETTQNYDTLALVMKYANFVLVYLSDKLN